jgi:hypothetical protein
MISTLFACPFFADPAIGWTAAMERLAVNRLLTARGDENALEVELALLCLSSSAKSSEGKRSHGS